MLNFLKLYDEKTEFILFGNKCNISNAGSLSLNVNGSCITNVSKVRNLGAILDSEMSMEKFVVFKCQSAMYYLRLIAKIRNLLDVDTTKTLICALVTSRIDYCNSLLIGINTALLHRLQIIQNSAARLISQTSRRDHISPILMELH